MMFLGARGCSCSSPILGKGGVRPVGFTDYPSRVLYVFSLPSLPFFISSSSIHGICCRSERFLALESEVSSLLDRGGIEEVVVGRSGVLLLSFVVPWVSGRCRPVLVVSRLNSS